MSQTIECEFCNSMTAQLQSSTKSAEVSWTDPSGWKDVYWAEYACSNCAAEFSQVLPSVYDGSAEDMELIERCKSYNSNVTYTSPNTYPAYDRGIGFRGTRTMAGYSSSTNSAATQINMVARNRRRKTAGIKDIKSKRESTSEHGITEIDLELG
jgi:hypothetical protein